ncbi:MAG: hypothetical protein E7176_01095 [Erysipelotrichaceae bacterium]|nr:hypothetical protein [Erysipelotrichaceae bacterium]
MKYIKRILTLALVAILGVSIASCGSEKRNTVVPYGNLDLNATVATSEKNITLTNKELYTRFRAKGYDILTETIKSELYKNEVNALNNLIFSESYESLSDEDKKVLAYNNDGETNSISEERYNELKELYCETLSSSLATSIFNSTDKYTIDTMTDEAKTKAIKKYIDSQVRLNISIDEENIEYSDNNNDDIVEINLSKIPSEIIKPLILSEAEKYYAKKELYKIADEEYLNVGTEEETKNNNYLFYEDNIAKTYASSYKTFGNYKAIIITFNSRREAMEAMEELGTDITSENVLASYLSLYNSYYYPYGTQTEEDVDTSKLFNYTISLKENMLDNISSSVNTLITETLEDGEFLIEPRNLNNKYVLAYRIETTYEYDEKEYDELDEAQKASMEQKIKNNLIDANGASYVNTAFDAAIKNSNIEIYDPLFETKFRNAYTDYYETISVDNQNIGKNLIAKINDAEFTVEDFYNKALSKYGAAVITNFFQQEYALKYLEDYIDAETIEANEKTLSDAIKAFKKGEDTTYAKEVGVETYLLGAYGYADEASVLRYYYNAESCLSTYKSKVVFNEWATEDHQISDSAKLVLERILAAGNPNYSDLFSINLDHVLINIDYNADGTPDDPDKFISEHPELKEEFEQEVASLMKALYKEAIHSDYSDNTLYETLKYVANQFNKGATLRSDNSLTWDDFKTKFNFLLTVEQLASSGDITQDSVSSFVVPFADYVKEIYKKVKLEGYGINDEDNEVGDDDINKNGNFITPAYGLLEVEGDVDQIKAETLCKTVYGYHLLIINSYDNSPKTLDFTKEKDDTNGYQSAIQVLLYEDKDDSANNVYVTLDAYNSEASTASLNQLFIYYVQSKNGIESSLDAEISSLLSSLFTDAMTAYSSSNFQNMILLDELKITSDNQTISTLVENERNHYANLVVDYDADSEFNAWIDPEMDWSRPDEK